MLAVYGDDCLPKSTICEWSELFKHGRESLDDDPRLERLVVVITSDVVEKTKCLVLEDAILKKRQLEVSQGVPETTVFRILHKMGTLGRQRLVHSKCVSLEMNPWFIIMILNQKQRVDAVA
uniref:Mos1 transposase HTH domain-containing protein n=1 Tax=Photinus pyralis TaxID=7054 RepID=A0A1Y1LZT5_PHOPY